VGLYKARLDDADGRSERFRLLLFAAEPDRIHGEVLTPVGGTALIFDGGDGRIAITLVRERVAFAGRAEPEAIEKLIGVRVPLGELVHGLLHGLTAHDGPTVVREPAGREGLPELFEISAGERSLRLQLKRLRALDRGHETLGTGQPPAGLELLPLERFEPLRQWEEEAEPREGGEP
jgi:hypothetical protein